MGEVKERGEIVVYRNDKSIVLYDQSGQIRAMPMEPVGIREKKRDRGTECPFCGSVLTGERYDYVAKAYFYLLQKSFQSYESARPRGFNSYISDQACTSVGSSWNGGDDGSIFDSLESELPSEEVTECPKNIPKYLLITGYYERFFIEGPKLGSGSYGHVFNCVHILDEIVLGEYAVKKLPVGDDMDWLRRAIKEVKIRENIRHKNVVDYNHSWLEMYGMNEMCPRIPYLFILMEYCNGGDLQSYVQSIVNTTSSSSNFARDTPSVGSAAEDEMGWDGNYLSDDEIMILFTDVLSGLDYLHKNFIIHRDLKPSNILLKFVKNSACAIISDFGTCEVFSEKREGSGFTGTVEYTAPELLRNGLKTGGHQGGPPSSLETTGGHTNKVDMWSLGVVLFYMSFAQLPFYSKDMKECIRLILECEPVLPGFPERSRIIKGLIGNLLSKDSASRMDCDSILTISEINRFLLNNEYNSAVRYNLYRRFKHFKCNM